MKKSSKPLICITSGTSGSPKNPELYIEAIEKAGGFAEFVLPEAESVTKEFISKTPLPSGERVIILPLP